jgi:hypothetical protein
LPDLERRSLELITALVLNVIFAVLGLGAVTALMRFGHLVAGGRLDAPEPLAVRAEAPYELDRAA